MKILNDYDENKYEYQLNQKDDYKKKKNDDFHRYNLDENDNNNDNDNNKKMNWMIMIRRILWY